MHWIVQSDQLNATDLQALCSQLYHQRVQYTCVRLVPIFQIMEPEVVPTEPHVFIMGNKSIGKIVADRGWTPGYFGNNLNYRLYLEHYGQHMLNYDAVIGSLEELERHWKYFFVRPISSKLSFAGTVMSWDELLLIRENVAKVKNQSDATLQLSDEMIMAPYQEIYAEYRFWVVDGQIVTGSRHKVAHQSVYSREIDTYIVSYAQKRVDQWQPDRAFVIDIADSKNGLKVIGINAINSSEFYGCNVGNLVAAIEQMKFN